MIVRLRAEQERAAEQAVAMCAVVDALRAYLASPHSSLTAPMLAASDEWRALLRALRVLDGAALGVTP